MYYDKTDISKGPDPVKNVVCCFKGVDYHCIINDISKSDAIHLLEISLLDDHGYIWNTFQRNQYYKSRVKLLFWQFGQRQKSRN